MTEVFYQGNSNALIVTSLTNVATKALLTDLDAVTVTASICPSGSSTPVTNGGPVTLSCTSRTSGRWAGVFDKAADLAVGRLYDVLLTIDGGSTLYAQFRVPCRVQARAAL